LGHKNFCTGACYVGAPGSDAAGGDGALLVTSSGDGSVRLWEPHSGSLLHTFIAAPPRTAAAAATDGAQAVVCAAGSRRDAASEGGQAEEEEAEDEQEVEQQEDEEDEEQAGRPVAPDCAAVLWVAASQDGKHVVALVEGEHEVQVSKQYRHLGSTWWIRLVACIEKPAAAADACPTYIISRSFEVDSPKHLM
jgi:hypothetical protein